MENKSDDRDWREFLSRFCPRDLQPWGTSSSGREIFVTSTGKEKSRGLQIPVLSSGIESFPQFREFKWPSYAAELPSLLNNHAANLRLLRQIYCRSAYNQITRLKIIHSNPTLSLQNKAMAGTKRKNGHESSNEVYSNKSRAKPTVEARVDPTYGQRSALPGLDDDANIEGYDDDLNYDDQDALNYLRTVRLVLLPPPAEEWC